MPNTSSKSALRLAILLDKNGEVTVLSDDSSVQVLVLRPAGEGEEPLLLADDSPVSVEALAQGLPHYQPERVASLYQQVLPQLSAVASKFTVPKEARTQLPIVLRAWARGSL